MKETLAVIALGSVLPERPRFAVCRISRRGTFEIDKIVSFLDFKESWAAYGISYRYFGESVVLKKI